MKYESEYFNKAIIFKKEERVDVYIPCDVINALQHGFFSKKFLNLESDKMTVLLNVDEIIEIHFFNHSLSITDVDKEDYICY